MLEVSDILPYQIANVADYSPKSHNLDRQIRGLLGHLFVRYPAPDFLYDVCVRSQEPFNSAKTRPTAGFAGLNVRKDPFAKNRWLYREWFVTIAQGRSFQKIVKGFMTSREAVVFLKGPRDSFVHENAWWAKMTVAGIPIPLIRTLNERVLERRSFEDGDARLAELIQFFGRFHSEMNRRTVDEIVDCIVWKLDRDPTFRLKGRTVGAMVKISNEWHMLMQRARLGHHIAWRGPGFPDWEMEAADCVWSVIELRDNKELLAEGRKMHHCVYSYVDWCYRGRSAIFSLRRYLKVALRYTDDGLPVWEKSVITEHSRATIEVNASRVIVQARSKSNEVIGVDERKVLKMWASEKGLQLAPRP